ncbi:glycosyltransferase [Thalassococcus sp. BH17M4-6]|uniref:glycosyltransferase n=1 Tax=Thalassococcus sp. BH17M4-6 TaxID=3413148 RepID=UPI003BE45B53
MPLPPAEQLDPKLPAVGILLAVYKGAADLPDQLDSLVVQDDSNWRLLISDDGSCDATAALVAAFKDQMPRRQVICLEGPGRGAAQNFLFLIGQWRRLMPAGSLMAFCDQDDVWLPDRLSRGRAALSSVPEGVPALYCSRTWITDANLATRRRSVPRPRPPGFRNALVQNIASGNTILLNPAAAALLAEATEVVRDVVVHDWWAYLLVTGAGGVVVHDDAPTLLYRQHSGNQIGANDHLRARCKRIRQLLRGDFRDWNATNIAALGAVKDRLTPENRALLDAFAAMRAAPLPRRLIRLTRLHLYRQSKPAQAALWLAAVLGRL